MKSIGLDTETTGLDPFHGSLPYLVVTCDQDDMQSYWEMDVDPLTRTPIVPKGDLEEIAEEIYSADKIVFINSKYDMQVLEAAGVPVDWEDLWDRIHDISVSAHLLGSAQLKDLTTQSIRYIGANLEQYEKAVLIATQKARRICRLKSFKEKYGVWAIAEEGREDMPTSGGSGNAKADMWLLRAIAHLAPDYLPTWEGWQAATVQVEKINGKRVKTEIPSDPIENHPWWDLAKQYALPDPWATLHVHEEHMKRIEDKGLMCFYEERRRCLKTVYRMEKTGVTVSKSRLNELVAKFQPIADEAEQVCLEIADGRIDKLPVAGRSNKLNSVVFDYLKMESPKLTANGNPSMDKEVLETWSISLDPESREYQFIHNLRTFRKYMTALSYMNGYQKYWVDIGHEDVMLLHPSLNMTGTTTLRWSSSHPNEQNISKKEGANVRYAFGPPPTHVWASIDYENLELRIPAYESGEDDLIDLFERADEPPFYGSNHLLNFSTIYPDIWHEALKQTSLEEVAAYVKKTYKSTWYQRCKNGGFAVQYGAIERAHGLSTADRAFGREGCHRLLKEKFAKQEKLNQRCILEAQETGFVQTIPDKEIDATQGYPIQCSRTKYGNISPTIPLNYHVQGTACWIIMIAMMEVEAYIMDLNKKLPSKLQWALVMQVHDELVIQVPRVPGARKHLKEICRIMGGLGDRINVPLKVGCDIHENNWEKGSPLE